MFLAFWNKLRQKLRVPIFFIDGKYWVWCYPNLCNIRRCYPNILSVCPAHPGQGIPTELISSLTRECHIVSVVTRGRWGHNTRVRCGPQIIYICAVISAQLSSSPLTCRSLSDSLHENSVTRIMSIILRLPWSVLQRPCDCSIMSPCHNIMCGHQTQVTITAPPEG